MSRILLIASSVRNVGGRPDREFDESAVSRPRPNIVGDFLDVGPDFRPIYERKRPRRTEKTEKTPGVYPRGLWIRLRLAS